MSIIGIQVLELEKQTQVKTVDAAILSSLDNALWHWKQFSDPDKLEHYRAEFINYILEGYEIAALKGHLSFKGDPNSSCYLAYLDMMDAIRSYILHCFVGFLYERVLDEQSTLEHIADMSELVMITAHQKEQFTHTITSWVIESVKEL